MRGAEIPKVLYKLEGRPMIEIIVENLYEIGIEKPIVVVGYKKEMVNRVLGKRVRYARQKKQLGTGHAVKAAEKLLKGKEGTTLVVYGDMPLWSKKTYRTIEEKQKITKAEIVITSIELSEEFKYGRVIRSKDGKIRGVVEERDCTFSQLKIKEKNAGLYAFDNFWLFNNLSKLKNKNTAGEYYLTDMISLAVKQGKKVEAIWAKNKKEGMGVNTLEDYQAVKRYREKVTSKG